MEGMDGQYDDIIDLPRWNPKNHKRMPMANRAAQFAPFAALAGHDEAIRETARITHALTELDTDTALSLNEKINVLIDKIASQPVIEVTYFVKDIKKAGGSFTCYTGSVRLLDEFTREIVFTDGMRISFENVRDIRGDIFN